MIVSFKKTKILLIKKNLLKFYKESATGVMLDHDALSTLSWLLNRSKAEVIIDRILSAMGSLCTESKLIFLLHFLLFFKII